MKFVSATKEYTTFRNHVPAPMFRKSIWLKTIPEKVPLKISGLGFYELFINGEKITKGLLAPYISNPDHIVYYDCYDITSYLRMGENVIGIILGNGMQNSPGGAVWFFDKAKFRSAPKFAIELELEGNLITAEDFVCSESAILFDDLRCGVFYDARKEQIGWCSPGFDDTDWESVLPAEPPRGILQECFAEPITIQREISPVAVRIGKMKPYFIEKDSPYPVISVDDFPYSEYETEKGYLYDYGVNTAGILRLKIQGKSGQMISVFCYDVLDSDSDLDIGGIQYYPKGYTQRLLYICRGSEEEIFETPFTYYGFRYLFVTGITEEQATKELFTCLEAHSNLETIGGFSCSDYIVNQLYTMADRSDRSNFYYFPTDCPQREKNAWTGDASASAEHMILHLNTENSWREWLHNIRIAQDVRGALPGIVPTAGWGYEWGNGPGFDRVLFELPYMAYRYRGNTQMITENAHAMMGYLEYVSRCRDEDGIITMGLGDWRPVGKDTRDYQMPLGLSGTIMTVEMCRQAEIMFKAIHLKLHQEFAHSLRKELITAIRKRYINQNTMIAEGNSQSAQAMCIYYGIFDESEKEVAFSVLMEILKQDQFKMTTGFLGGRVLFHVLAENGEAELAYRMITDTTFPGYGLWVKEGDTTLREGFYQGEKNRMISMNHHFWGDISHWFVRHITGLYINPEEHDPSFILIKPKFISSLHNATAFYDTVRGRVRVSWERKDDAVFLTVDCNEKITCNICLESGFLFEDSGQNNRKGTCLNARIIMVS